VKMSATSYSAYLYVNYISEVFRATGKGALLLNVSPTYVY